MYLWRICFSLTLQWRHILSAMASQITGAAMVCSAVCSGAYQRKHQSSASLAFVRGIHRWPVNSPHKGLVTQKMVPFDDVIMNLLKNDDEQTGMYAKYVSNMTRKVTMLPHFARFNFVMYGKIVFLNNTLKNERYKAVNCFNKGNDIPFPKNYASQKQQVWVLKDRVPNNFGWLIIHKTFINFISMENWMSHHNDFDNLIIS